MITTGNGIKVSFDRPRYKTDGKEVSCELRYRIVVPETMGRSSWADTTSPDIIVGFNLGDEHRVVGKARCNEDDTFDKHTGREIAEARAEAKAYKHADKLVKKYVKAVAQKYFDMALEFQAKADHVQDHNKGYVLDMGK